LQGLSTLKKYFATVTATLLTMIEAVLQITTIRKQSKPPLICWSLPIATVTSPILKYNRKLIYWWSL
jgi:hypothetical protein